MPPDRGVDVINIYYNGSIDRTVARAQPFADSGFVSMAKFPGR